MSQPQRPFDATRLFVTSLFETLHNERLEALSFLPPIQRGPRFARGGVLFLKRLAKLERAGKPQIIEASRRIQSLYGTGWENEIEIVDLHMKLCACVEQTAHHPRKTVGALLVSRENETLAMASNQLAPGVPFFARYLRKGRRHHQILCAEQALLMRERGLAPVFAKGSLTGHKLDHAVREAVLAFRAKIQTAPPAPLERLKNATMVVSNVSCLLCSKAEVANGVQNLIVDTTKSARFNTARQLSMQKGQDVLKRGNVRVLRFDPQTYTLV